MQRVAQSNVRKRATLLGIRRFSKDDSDNLYLILGLSRYADTDRVKEAFREKAKALHPDAVGDSEIWQSEVQFRRVLTAYQVLRDPATRRAYDLSIDEGNPEFLRRAAKERRQNGEAGPNHANEFQWSWVRDLNVESDKPAHLHNSIDRLRSSLQAEWHEVLLHAYLGPAVDMSTRELPSCFEAEERSHTSEPDILHIVSGRQFLASVRERPTPYIDAPIGPEAGKVGPPATPTSGDEFNSSRISRVHSDALECREAADSRSLANKPPSSFTVDSDVYSRLEDSHAQDVSSGSSSGSPGVRWLELRWKDGTVGAVLRQVIHPSGKLHIDVHCEGIHVWQERGSICHTHHSLSDPSRCQSTPHGQGRPTNPRTHQAVVSETPFVKHLDFIALNGVGGLKRDRLVSRCKRAWLPHSSTWLFPPRCNSHSIGGWYIEAASSDHRSHPAWIRPEVLILRAAVETLATEALTKAEQEQTPIDGLWPRLKGWFRLGN